jgi:hypothetical protein
VHWAKSAYWIGNSGRSGSRPSAKASYAAINSAMNYPIRRFVANDMVLVRDQHMLGFARSE